MLSEPVSMEDLDNSTLGSSTASGSGSAGLIDSPGSCLSSGYCSDDAGSGHDDVFFGRHGKDCWMSTADVDTVDLLRGSLPPFDVDLSCTTSSAAAAGLCHDSVVDTAVKFDDIVDNWLFHSMSVPSPCDDHDWPLPSSTLSTSASHELDDMPTDSVLADLLLNQSAYTAASRQLSRPETEMNNQTPSVELGLKPSETVTTSGVEVSSSSLLTMPTTKRTLDLGSCESSATRRRLSSPCRGCCGVPEVTSGNTSTTCCDCSTDSARRRSSSVCTAPSTAEVDLSRLRAEWPGFADVVASEPVCPTDTNSAGDDEDMAESTTKNSNVDDTESETASASAESSLTRTPRPVILEALLRSSNKLDANKGSSAALVLICGLTSGTGALCTWSVRLLTALLIIIIPTYKTT